MKFSQKIGITPTKLLLQIESMDDDLRVGLWNVFTIYCLDKVYERVNDITENVTYHNFFRSLWLNFFKLPIDTMITYIYDLRKYLKEKFMAWEWYEVYDFIEFIIKEELPYVAIEFKEGCNFIMQRELSGYRVVEDEIVKITDENEIKEIEEAIKKSKDNALKGVEKHLESALSKIADRKNHDYRNSVKESISAVESISQIITRNPKATLGEALKVIENQINIHEA